MAKRNDHAGASEKRDVRFGHDLSSVQNENGVDLGVLRAHLALSVEQRLRSLESRARFVGSLRAPSDSA